MFKDFVHHLSRGSSYLCIRGGVNSVVGGAHCQLKRRSYESCWKFRELPEAVEADVPLAYFLRLASHVSSDTSQGRVTGQAEESTDT